MDFSIPKKALADMFGVCLHSADSNKSPVPALSCVHVFSENGQLVMEANNLRTAVRMVAPATITRPGSVLLPRDFGERVNAMPIGDVRVLHTGGTDNRVELSTMVGARKFLVSVLYAADFPPLPSVSTERPEDVFPIATLLNVLQTVKPTVLDDDTKPKMSSVLLRWAWGELEAMSCDGHRFTRLSRTIESVTTTGQIMIPQGLLSPLISALDHGMKVSEKDCSIRFNKGHIVLKVGTTEVFSKLTEDDPLPITDAIPTSWNTCVRMLRTKFLEGVKGIEATKIGSVQFKVKKDSDKLFMYENDVSSGDAADEVDAEITGPKWGKDEKERMVKLDVGYVKSAIEHIDSEEVVFAFEPYVAKAANTNPALIAPTEDLPASPRDAKHLVGIMPMKM